MMRSLASALLGSALAVPWLIAQPQPPPVIITLERTTCFGTCPAYSLTITGDGRITYTGQRFVRVVGSAADTISPDAVAELASEFERIRYFDLKDRYDRIEQPDGSFAIVSDLPTTTTSIRIGSRFKQVVDYVGSPQALKDLERTIDRVAGTQRWISVTPEVVRELQRDGWNAAGADGSTYMVDAIFRGDAETVESLLDAGADPNAPNRLPLAAARDPRVIRLLVAAGADVHRQTGWGETILILAVRSGRADSVAALLAAGARAGQTNRQGETPLQVAQQMAARPPAPPFPGETTPPPRELAEIIARLHAAGAK